MKNFALQLLMKILLIKNSKKGSSNYEKCYFKELKKKEFSCRQWVTIKHKNRFFLNFLQGSYFYFLGKEFIFRLYHP